MLFNSIDFAIFLPLVFIGYWFITNNNLKVQNSFLIFSSYFFYGYWDWRFLSLIAFSSIVDYLVGLNLEKTDDPVKRKRLLLVSIVVNLGFLAFFKYFNFFIDSFASSFTMMGYEINPIRLKLILPVGISFYTFQTLSYSIDVYRKKLDPTRDIIAFFAFVSFFPQLVAGPIERATNLLPQFYVKREFNYYEAVRGLKQVLWGLFKKLVIADNCAEYANLIFNDPTKFNSSALLLGAIFFSFQIYGDFSGYSDIAIGTSRLFGFRLMRNFANPYFSRDIAEFWRRWHISLSTWFRDYVYIPLGGSKGNIWMKIRNTFIIFIVSGFWHGANWTFVIWGAINAVYFIPLLLLKRNRANLQIVAYDRKLPTFIDLIKIISTFFITSIAWIFFRSDNVSSAFSYIFNIFSKTIISIPNIPRRSSEVIGLIILFVIIEWLGRNDDFALEKIFNHFPRPIKFVTFSFIIFIIGMYMQTHETPFIYFQF